ncbi:LPO_1073/Vpar_1526 family protein [Thermoanaerobacterium sp. DL9XJH110]|uniref:LPO_1073/Vpar_1526 family protein n=1 Tax=Thermoanaerobacterium sp. DL9XJH110 TaxID=3386643 RepID=UPI003BB63369
MLDGIKQVQKSGNNSTNIQANEVKIINGITYSEARQIAEEVFEANFYRLSEQAMQVAKARANEITDYFLSELQKRAPNALSSMLDPDMQFALYTSQREYARTGDKDLGQLLVDILVDRAKNSERTLMQIVLNESLSVVPKLTIEQFDALSLIFLIKYTKFLGVDSIQTLSDCISKYYVPFMDNLTKEASCYQHLQYTGCGSISIAEIRIETAFRERYSGLFCRGFKKDEFMNQIISSETFISEEINALVELFIPCFHSINLYQLRVKDNEELEKLCASKGISKDNITKIKNIYSNYLMSEQEVKEFLKKIHPCMDKLFDYWDNSYMKNIVLTSVGIAIAHANIRRKINESFNLSIWIK